MTPVASTAAVPRAGRVAVPQRPRRVSGPARRSAPARRSTPARRSAAASPLLQRAAALADARLLDRLIRGRAWIAVVGAMLMGLVFVQVSMLRLNTGIGRDVATAAQLERTNQNLRNTVAELAAGERIETAAQTRGMVMPAAGDVHYLHAGRTSADAAARGISAPAPVQQQPAVVEPTTSAPDSTAAVTQAAVTPAATQQQAPAVTPQQQAPAATPQQQAPTATSQPAATPTATAAGSGGAAPTP